MDGDIVIVGRIEIVVRINTWMGHVIEITNGIKKIVKWRVITLIMT